MSKIKQIVAREILNCKGNPTIETTVILNDGKTGIASCPSGTSVGNYEATEIKDHDEKRFGGLGMLKAISNVQNIIAPALLGRDVTNQQDIDRAMIELDGTQNKSRLGANSTLSVSMAVVKAAAKSSLLPTFLYIREYIKKDGLSLKIPTPIFNILNGGKHASGNIDFQEFIVVPASSKPYSECLTLAHSIYNSLKRLLLNNNLSTLVGDEGGFGPSIGSNKDGLSLLKQAAAEIGARPGFDLFFGIDAASSNFFSGKSYKIKDKSMNLSSEELAIFYEELAKEFNLLYLEDPMAEDDWEGWEKVYKKLSQQTLIVGDDITATNPYRLQMALDKKSISAIIIKPNQIGTVIEALAVVEIARTAGLKIIVSHRSGETNDDFIADFAVGVSADYVKFGAPTRGERVAKYNKLSLIERQIKAL
ncbi:phosphopyruvate hydratase [Patescibacteria group bacterium]|nr:phosphopyruvate hydratase [Patescibacteria group bacterium]